MRNRGVCLVVLALAAVAACQPRGLTPGEQTTLGRYLSCIDCIVALDSVRALAARKPDATVDSLYAALLNGPGLQAVAAAESTLALGYARDSAWRAQRGLSPLEDRDTYVNEARDRYVEGYQSQGAFGLGYIHTPRALQHLDSARARQLPASVHRAVVYALDSLPSR